MQAGQLDSPMCSLGCRISVQLAELKKETCNLAEVGRIISTEKKGEKPDIKVCMREIQ